MPYAVDVQERRTEIPETLNEPAHASLAWPARVLAGVTRYEIALIALFLLTLPLSNPWVRGDGVGYYAFARSLLIQHNLDFRRDWSDGNESFRMGRTDSSGRVLPEEFTSTGHLNNHFSIGPAILWSPFLVAADVGVRVYDEFGGEVARDGYSKPYLAAMALGTATYGFLAVFISFRIARSYVAEKWAFLGAIGIWLGSSLPVYMYFNPSWSHAHSAFTVALFAWYWMRTRNGRSWWQFLVLGMLGGLMTDVYYLNAIVLLLVPFEAVTVYRKARAAKRGVPIGSLISGHAVCAAGVFLAFLPTLIEKKIIYGSAFNSGYTERWFWNSPALLKVCFSATHGLFTWTPILLLAIAGFFVLYKYDPEFAVASGTVFGIFVYAVGCYQDWNGIASFGQRFLISLTLFFVLGLAALFAGLQQAWRRSAGMLATGATALLIVWNLGMIFQWGTHLIPARGPISWRDAAHNQVTIVPSEAAAMFRNYFTQREKLMKQIEQEDVRQLRSESSGGTE